MARLPSLDSRLACAASFFPACEYGADIGADHGRLSCYLLSSGRCKRMCVADISAESLRKAERLLALHHLSERADFRVGDGLQVLKEPADAAAILGMGGHTLCGILRSGQDQLYGAALILSAHTDVPLVRQTLGEIGYRITRERIVFDNKRFYVLMKAESGMECLTEKQLLIGPRLMEERPSLYPEYLQWRIGVLSCEQNADARKSLTFLKEEYEHVCHSEEDRRIDRGDRPL